MRLPYFGQGERGFFDLRLACYTQEEIGEREGVSQPQIKQILSEMAELPKPIKAAGTIRPTQPKHITSTGAGMDGIHPPCEEIT